MSAIPPAADGPSGRVEPPTGWPSARGIAPWLALFAGAFAFIAILVRPTQAGPVAFDAASSVLYFDRIVAGQRLEAFVNTTPKPLLTVVYGLAYGLTHDWRAVSIASISVTALGVVLGSALAHRVGGLAAGVAAAVFLVADSNLLIEASWAYGLPWAVACWFAAGLALTTRRPRYTLAGVALMLGALARPETFLLVGAATVIVILLAFRRRLPAGAQWILTAWLALPIMSAHDLLLTGDPLFWLRAASIYSQGLRFPGPGVIARRVAQTLIGNPLIALAALAAIVPLWQRASGRIVAAGLVVVGLGTGILLIAVAARGQLTLSYYHHPIALALGLAAAIGIASVSEFLSRIAEALLARRKRPAGPAADPTVEGSGRDDTGADRGRTTGRSIELSGRAVIQGGILLALGAIVFAPVLVSGATLSVLRVQRQLALDSDRAAISLARLVRERGIIAGPSGDPERPPDPAGYRILVPRQVQTRLAVTLGLPVTVVGPLVPDRPTVGLIHRNLVVFRDRLAETSGGVQQEFAGSLPIAVEGTRFRPLEADPAHGLWIWASDP